MNLHRIQNSKGAGLYANYLAVLGACDLIDRVGGHINVDFREGYYLDPSHGPNWWEYYFRQIQPCIAPFVSADDPVATAFPNWLQFNQHAAKMPRARASFLINKYIRYTPEVVERIEADLRPWDDLTSYSIGVHVRKTNKTDEGAPHLPNQFIAEQIDNARNNARHNGNENWRIFLATDDAKTAAFLKSQFGDRLHCLNALRSTNRYAVYNRSDPQTLNPDACRLGLEAVLDVHGLSQCDVLLATDSMMSIVAADMIYPMPVINMTSRYKGTEDEMCPFADHIQHVYGKWTPHPALEELCRVVT